MSQDDKISKPKVGFSFPISAAEARKKIKDLGFEFWDSPITNPQRIDLSFISGDDPFDHGYPLVCWRRKSRIAIFSLPDVSFQQQYSSLALDKALDEFSAIDKTPEEHTQETHFFIYRAYIGELGKVTITRNLLSRGHNKNWLAAQAAIDPRKGRGTEKIIKEFHLK